MKVVEFRIKKVCDDAVLPAYQHDDDAGMDLFSCEDYVLNPGERVLVKTGICVEFPKGYELQIRARSGLALKKGIGVLNSPGTIDAGYRGEIGVILINLGKDVVEIKKGDRIAQAVLKEVVRADIVESEDLSESKRGAGGFGSTGF